jgi:hypothetical protein
LALVERLELAQEEQQAQEEPQFLERFALSVAVEEIHRTFH